MEEYPVMVCGPPPVGVGPPCSQKIQQLPRLNVGCGTRPEPNFVNSDLYEAPGVDVVFDCQGKWPFPDNRFSGIYASHVVEHLDKPQEFFNEAWRVLHAEGSLLVRVPHSRYDAHAWADFTHKRPIPVESFYILGPKIMETTYNLQHKADRIGAWETKIVYQVLISPWMRRWLPKSVVYWAIEHLNNICSELIVWMKPIKTGEKNNATS